MLSKAILDTANELTRQTQATSPPLSELCLLLVKLQRATALQSEEPRAAILALRSHLEPHLPDATLVDGVTARVIDAIETHDMNRTDLHTALDALVDEVTAASAELADQLAATFRGGDVIVTLAQSPGGVVENALVDATTVAKENDDESLSVTVVQAGDETEHAQAMMMRLRAAGAKAIVVHAGLLGKVLARATKAVVFAQAGDVDDGLICSAGATALASMSVRAGVAVVAAVMRHTLQPIGAGGIAALASKDSFPGGVWEYENARDDRKRDAITIVAPAMDVVPVQKVELVVTDVGAFAPSYLASLVPNMDKGVDGETVAMH